MKIDWPLKIKVWQSGGTDFTSLLLTLIQKADPINQERLRIVFPDAVKAFYKWHDSPVGNDEEMEEGKCQ